MRDGAAMEVLEIGLGSVMAGGGELRFSVVASRVGVIVELFVSSPSCEGILLRMRPDALVGIEAKLAEAKAACEKMRTIIERV